MLIKEIQQPEPDMIFIDQIDELTDEQVAYYLLRGKLDIDIPDYFLRQNNAPHFVYSFEKFVDEHGCTTLELDLHFPKLAVRMFKGSFLAFTVADPSCRDFIIYPPDNNTEVRRYSLDELI